MYVKYTQTGTAATHGNATFIIKYMRSRELNERASEPPPGHLAGALIRRPPSFIWRYRCKIGLVDCPTLFWARPGRAHGVRRPRPCAAAAPRGIEILLITGRGCPILPDARNWCVAQALAADCDKVWFVDADIAWEDSIDDAINMLLAPVDIVCGVHQARNPKWNDPARLVVSWKKLPPTGRPGDGPVGGRARCDGFRRHRPQRVRPPRRGGHRQALSAQWHDHSGGVSEVVPQLFLAEPGPGDAAGRDGGRARGARRAGAVSRD